MNRIPTPIFCDKPQKISWKKIYVREYGVQYSEMAILCLSPAAKYHIPKPSVNQVVIPEGENTAFYIDGASWVELVESLNNKYTSHIKKLEAYEKQFIEDGKNYLETAERIAKLDFKKLTNQKLKKLYEDYQEKLFRYSVFAWTSFILNNYISEKAKAILDRYIKTQHKEAETQEIYNALFKPEKLAAILQLQSEVGRYKGKLTKIQFDNLYKRFNWLSCLDIHNKPWTKAEFRSHIETLVSTKSSKSSEGLSFAKYATQLKIDKEDLEYLKMAKRFVYIKDARDDFRRQGVFHALTFFQELARRMNVSSADISYLQQSEVSAFLDNKLKISKRTISERKKSFVLYIGRDNKLICLQGINIKKALMTFRLLFEEEKITQMIGTVASKGITSGKAVIVKGVADLKKVQNGDILVAVSTHPDYVSAMRKAAAIVTDEGGITSHAAIVSREFGIPCIVGTKNATSVLRDGDRIEVNAIGGVIKFIQ